MTRRLSLVALALGVRLLAASRTVVIPRDSVTLLDLARRAQEGDLASLLAHPQHPLYPLVTGLVARSGLALETAGIAVALLAGALVVLPLLTLGERLAGRRAALLAAILYAVSPYPVRFAAVPLTDSLHLLAVTTSLALGLRALDRSGDILATIGAGAASGFAYLVRPEGLVAALVLAPALALRHRGRARLLGPALLVTALLATTAPYLVHLHEQHGRWTVSGKAKAGGAAKADEWSRITGAPRPTVGASALEAGRELVVTLHPAMAVLALIGLFGRVRRPRAGTLVLIAAGLLVLLAGVRVHWLRGYLSHRHVLLPATLLLLAAGLGLDRLGRVIATRLARPEPVVLTVLVIALAALMLPKALHRQGEDKAALVEKGRTVAAADLAPGPLALAADPRIAYYADRRVAELPGPLRRGVEGRNPLDPAALAAWLAHRGALLYLAEDQAARWRASHGPGRLVPLRDGGMVLVGE